MGPLRLSAILAGLLYASALAAPVPALDLTIKHNDFSCKGTQPNPVILLHGTGATFYEDINLIDVFLQSKGFCTYSITYGAYEGFELVGGLKPVAESSQQIAEFIKEVKRKTGASKVDLVGHSEGGLQSLYTPKFGGVASMIDHIVAIAPPTHGADVGGLYKLAQTLGIDHGVDEILRKFGCAACNDVVTDGIAVTKLNDGKPIVQPGNKVTIITSKHDELVTPVETAFVHEEGVHNIFIQDYCPLDPVGHIGEAYDANTWNLVLNSLEDQIGRKFPCLIGSPGK